MRIQIMFLMLIAAATVVGCKPPHEQESPSTKSSLNTFIEGATGKTAVDAGKRMEADIQRISTAHNNELNEVLGE
ncbi:MAG: hypothetical protein HN341_12555 [Verrucomicrobia bacterium]|jgi:hypothetical protein|nr:hypothetical protein [Verrucomicrobiota bacterium]